MDLKTEILELLKTDDNVWDGYCKVKKVDKGFELSYGAMYDAPGVTFAMLKGFSDLFGTDEIDVDNYGHGGCDTCDYGSDYGHDIQIYKPTKNVKEMTKLVGSDLLE